MKKYIFLLILVITISCNAQKNSFMIPEVDNNFEKIEKNLYQRLENKNYISEYDLDKNYIELLLSKKVITYRLTPKESYFQIIKVYNHNANIITKGLSINTGYLKKGIWYEFDEQGKLIKETNYDQPYKFTFEDILQFCEKHKIKIDKGPILQSTGWYNEISREIENNHPVWKIEHLKRSDLVEIIKLDGITGKILGTSTYKYINN